MRFAYFIIASLLLYNAGAWAYLFIRIYHTGAVVVEPNTTWLLCEVALATVFALVGLLAVIHSLRNI